MITFRIYRDNSEAATEFDMGDIEFCVDKQKISSRGNSKLSNMIYISITDLIDGLLRLKNGTKNYEFIAADSSFIIQFKSSSTGVSIINSKKNYGSEKLIDLLTSIDLGIDDFLTDPKNKLPAGSPVYEDLNNSRQALKNALA